MSAGLVLLGGGGTGGHVFPALATATALRRMRPDVDVEFVGTADRLEAKLVPEAGWRLHTVPSAAVAGRRTVAALRLPFVLAGAVRRVRRLLRERDVVAAAVFGGYTSVPLALAARTAGVPLVVHEQNAVPGLANRLAARGAAVAAVTFPGTVLARAPRTVETGNPIRPALDGLDLPSLRPAALEAFGLDEDRRTLLVFGGSQGARRINEAVVAAVAAWPSPERLQVLHAAGPATFEATRRAWDAALTGDARRPLVRCVEFVERMDLAYAAADLVVCRAGASTLAELTVLGLPAVLVPYPYAADDHQTANARALADAGGAVVVADADLDGERLLALAGPLLEDAERRVAMARAVRALGRPDAAHAVAALVLEVARPPRSGEPLAAGPGGGGA